MNCKEDFFELDIFRLIKVRLSN